MTVAALVMDWSRAAPGAPSIHNYHGWGNGQRSANLILLCPTCHKRAEAT